MRVLVDAFKKKYDPSGFNISFFYGPRPSFQDVQSAFGAMSFLGTKRCIIFEDFFLPKTTELQKQILDFLIERDAESHVTIFWHRDDLPGASSRLGVVKHATHETFDLLEGAELTAWIQKEARRKDLRLAFDVVSELKERIGSDLWQMSNVMDQLAMFKANDGAVTKDDVGLFSDAKLNDNIFHLTDALGRRQSHVALELLFDQLRSGSHPLYLLTMLLRHFRILLQVAESPDATSAHALGVHPYVLQKSKEQLQYFSYRELAHLFEMLQSIETELKLGAKDAETLFTRFILQVAKA